MLTCDDDEVSRACPDRTVTTYCDSTGTAKCEYLLLPYKVNVNAVEVSVPVGDSSQAGAVVGLTTLVVSCGTIYLLGSVLFRKAEPKME